MDVRVISRQREAGGCARVHLLLAALAQKKIAALAAHWPHALHRSLPPAVAAFIAGHAGLTLHPLLATLALFGS